MVDKTDGRSEIVSIDGSKTNLTEKSAATLTASDIDKSGLTFASSPTIEDIKTPISVEPAGEINPTLIDLSGGIKPTSDGPILMPTASYSGDGTIDVHGLAPVSESGDLLLGTFNPGSEIVSRNEPKLYVTDDGALKVVYASRFLGAVEIETDAGFVTGADEFRVHITWNDLGVGIITFENLENGEIAKFENIDANQFTGTEVVVYETQTGTNAGTGLTEDIVTDSLSLFQPEYEPGSTGVDGQVDGSDDADGIDGDFVDDEGDKVTSGADTILGNGGNDTIYGENGADQIFGGSGEDLIHGGGGSDVVYGGSGDDEINGSGGQDVMYGGSGDDVLFSDGSTSFKETSDTVYGGKGDDMFFAGAGDLIYGGTNSLSTSIEQESNTLFINNSDDVQNIDYHAKGGYGTVTYNNGQTLEFYNIQKFDGLPSSSNLDGIVNGSDSADVIDNDYADDPHGDRVDSNDPILSGHVGDMDVIEAYGGNDTIMAGDDDDTVYAGSGDDVAHGNAGSDIVDGASGGDTIYGDNGNAFEIITPDAEQGVTNYEIGEDGELCIDLDTMKSIKTEDVWFASNFTITGLDGSIDGDCDLVEGETNVFNVTLSSPVTSDTWVTVTVSDGTANQADDPNEFTSGTYVPGGIITQYWWQNQAHFDWAQAQTWYDQTNATLMSDGPDAQGNMDTDSYVGTSELVNDFRIFDTSGAEVTGQTFQVLIPAGQSTSQSFTVEGLRETSINGNRDGFGGPYSEGNEDFTMQVTNIDGYDVAAPVKTVDVLDNPNNTYSPISFDLNGNGEIDVTGTSTGYGHAYTAGAATVSFDIDADGGDENIEWLQGNGDGMLVDTSLIGPGNAIDGSALFGDEGGTYANGYEKLDLRDTDGDDQLTGSELSNLAIWVDDGDAVLEAGELETLAEHGITALDTTPNVVVSGGETFFTTNTLSNAEVTGDVTYSLSGPDAEFFEIDPDTGKLTYADGFEPDHSNPADLDGDNIYEVDVVRTCDNPASVTTETIKLEIQDPCIGGDDSLNGGSGDDVIHGQGGDDVIMGDSGDDVLTGGCGDDTLIGDTGNDGVDLDPSGDGCITVADDQPCFCLDMSTTKTMVTEDVWFAEKLSLTTPTGEFIGNCDLKEGENGTFTIQLDNNVVVDTVVAIQITNGTAMQATGTFNEYIYTNPFQSNPSLGQPGTDETQWWFGDANHLNTAETSWGSWENAFFNSPNFPGIGQTYSDAYVGAGQLTNDFEILDSSGSMVVGNVVYVTVPAGSSVSEAFTVETNIEAMIRGYPGNEYYTYSEGDEAFDMQIVQIAGQNVNGAQKEVMIEDQHFNVYSPIAFDLNWDGEINVTGDSTEYGHAFGVGSTTVNFDIDGDGLDEEIEWMEGNTDGLLIDMAQVLVDGGVASGRSLFGDEGGTYSNGYEKLDLLDTVGGDDVLNGSELDDLAIWIDDGDGVLEAGETVSLASQGITELSTVGVVTNVAGENLIRSETEADMEALGW